MLARPIRRATAAAIAITGLALLTLEHWGHFSVRDVFLSGVIAAAVVFLIADRSLPPVRKPPHDHAC